MEAVIWDGEEMGAKYDRIPLAAAPVPDELKESAQQYHEELVELAVEQDDDALMAYLDGTAPDVDTLKKCIRKGTLALKFVPVLTGTAFKNKGVQPLLDAVVYYMPAPTDVKDIAVSTTTNANFAVHVYSTLHAALERSVGSRSTKCKLLQ
eukprot:2570-Heterococcus_DN1.PRE.1